MAHATTSEPDEHDRLRQLLELQVLDSPPEAVFDSLARMASNICEAPIALLSLIDRDRQWFKANVGLPGVGQTPRAVAFCSHAIQQDDVFEVPDASLDPRFAANPLVTGDPRIRFYAGMPLALPEGARVGTLCVIDRKPRQLTATQVQTLRQLAVVATQALVMRRNLVTEVLNARSAYERRLADSEAMLRRTGRLAGVGGWELDLQTQDVRWTDQTRLIHEAGPDFRPTLESAVGFYAPQARPVIEAAVQAAIADGTPWDLELQLVTANGRQRWVRAVGEAMQEDGRVVRLTGAFQDITERRALEERLRHRERFLQTVTDAVPVRIAYVDRDLRYQFVNAAHCVRFGRHRDQIVGHTRAELLGVDDAAIRPHLVAALKGEARRFEFEEATAAGPCVIESRLVPDVDDQGRVRGFFAVGDDITWRKAIETQLHDALARAQDLYDNAPCGYYSLDPEGLFLSVNRQMLEWLGCTLGEALAGLGLRDFFSEAGRSLFQQMFPVFIREGRAGPVDFELRSRTGEVRWVSLSATAIYDDEGRFRQSRSVMYDVTEVRRTQAELRRLNHEQLTMLENEVVGITRVCDRMAKWNNRAMCRMFGYRPDELNGQPSRMLYADDATYERVGVEGYATLLKGQHYRTQARMVRKDGTALWIDLNGAMLSPETGESMWLFTDITAMKEHQFQVEHIAFHDGLTGLPNRLLLADRLTSAMAVDHRLQRQLAVCYLDLDGFKAVNDRHGHAAGDVLLREVARRIQACIRDTDTVARLGGDEFVLVLTPLSTADESRVVLARLVESIEAPVSLGGGRVARVSASVGVAHFPEHGSKASDLLRCADEAMYDAKRAGKGRITVYEPVAVR